MGQKHYFCESCGGVDQTAHECRTPGCARKGHPLTECDCGNPDSHKKPADRQPGEDQDH